MLDISVHPNTLDEVESSILQWYEDVSKGQQTPIRFYRAPSSSNRLSLVPKPESDVKFELRDQCVLIQVKQCRLTMNLDKFQITTAFKDRRLRLEIERHPTPEYRFLTSVLKQVAGTKHPVFVSRSFKIVAGRPNPRRGPFEYENRRSRIRRDGLRRHSRSATCFSEDWSADL